MSIKKSDAGIFAAGVLFGTAGIKILTSKDAQKAYTHITAAVLRAKDCILNTAQTVQESASDIYAEAQMINEERAEWDDIFDDLDDELDDEEEEADAAEDLNENEKEHSFK